MGTSNMIRVERPAPARAVWVTVLLFVGAGLGAPPVAGQGAVSGHVLDRHGTPIAEAQVYLRGYGLGAFSDSTGRFALAGASGDTYSLVVERVGYRPYEAPVNVPSGANQVYGIDVTLMPDTILVDVAVAGRFSLGSVSHLLIVASDPTRVLGSQPDQALENLRRLLPGFWDFRIFGPSGSPVAAGTRKIGDDRILSWIDSDGNVETRLGSFSLRSANNELWHGAQSWVTDINRLVTAHCDQDAPGPCPTPTLALDLSFFDADRFVIRSATGLWTVEFTRRSGI